MLEHLKAMGIDTNPKTAGLKFLVGVPFTIAIGLLVKANFALDNKITEKYSPAEVDE